MFLNGLYGFPSAAAQAVTTALDKAVNAVTNAINVSLGSGTSTIGTVSLGGNPRQSAAGISASVSAGGALSVSAGEGFGLFSDVFDTLDTTNRWTTSGTVPPFITTSLVGILCGSALSASSALNTQPTFAAQGFSSVGIGWMAQSENVSNAAGTAFYLNSHRFAGVGTVPTTWTSVYTGSSTSGPILNGVGYEIDTDGKLYPVLYSNGVRLRPPLTFGGTDIATGNGTGTGSTFGGLKALADGLMHEWAVIIRPDVVLWYIDTFDLPIASLNYSQSTFIMPAVQTLPLRFHTINGPSTAPSGTMNFQIGSVSVSDTGAQTAQLSDGVYPWRKATIKPGSTSAVATDTALVVTPLPLTKGTQGTTGLMVQRLIDAGRTNLVYSATAAACGATGVETAITLSCSADTGTRASAVSFTVTSGQIFRITSLTFGSISNATITNQITTFRLRVNSAGAVTTSSNTIYVIRSATYSGSTLPDRITIPIPEGLEITGTGTTQFGVTAHADYVTNGPTWDVAITGFEY